MLRRSAAIALLALAAVSLAAKAQTYTVFDIAGAEGGIFPVGINGNGDIAGYYTDSVGVSHGFLRTADGAIVKFDVPGAAAGTFPTGINADGTMTGYFWVTAYEPQGFVRAPDGAISVYNVPDSYATQPRAINAAGDIAGYYTPAVTPVAYPTGFIHTAAGVLTTFGLTRDTLVVNAINDQNDATGNADVMGFVRTHDGQYTSFTVPGAPIGLAEVFPVGINNAGTVAGYAQNQYCGGDGFCILVDPRSFVRSADGKITVFTVPRGKRHGTFARGLNNAGTIVGTYYTTLRAHGFLRSADATVTPFDVPRMTQTMAAAINDGGVVAGRCADAAGQHGFVRTP